MYHIHIANCITTLYVIAIIFFHFIVCYKLTRHNHLAYYCLTVLYDCKVETHLLLLKPLAKLLNLTFLLLLQLC